VFEIRFVGIKQPFLERVSYFTEESELSLWIACGAFKSKYGSFGTLSRFVHLLPIFWQWMLINIRLLKDLPLIVWWLFIISLFQWLNVCIDKPILLNHMNIFLFKASFSWLLHWLWSYCAVWKICWWSWLWSLWRFLIAFVLVSTKWLWL